MKDNYLNLIFQSANEVIYELAEIDFIKGEVRTGEWSRPGNNNSIVLSFQGELSDGVIYSMTNDTIENIIRQWFKKENIELDRLDELKKSCLSEIKKIDEAARVVMCTALDQQAAIDESLSLGACGYIAKPIKKEDVVNALKNLKEKFK